MSDRQREPRRATEEAYAAFAPFVRRSLSSLGVRDADLDDVCHEVFLVVHHRSGTLDEIRHFEPWLYEICRRVAAGYRRRAVHKIEVLTDVPPETAALDDAQGEIAQGSDIEQLHSALGTLDGESRELLALHEVGEMPVTEIAKLVDRDRKTVSKRLDLGRRKLFALLQRDDEPRGGSGSPSASIASPRREPADVPAPAIPLSPDLEVVSSTPGVTIGLMGNCVIAAWRGVASVEALETLLEVGQRLIARCGGKIAYLSIVEAKVSPPPRAGREKIVESLNIMGPSVLGYATVLLGGASWIVQPIMSGLVFLSRPRFPMSFFKGVEPASEWLCAHFARGPDGPLDVPGLCEAAEVVRSRLI